MLRIAETSFQLRLKCNEALKAQALSGGFSAIAHMPLREGMVVTLCTARERDSFYTDSNILQAVLIQLVVRTGSGILA